MNQAAKEQWRDWGQKVGETFEAKLKEPRINEFIANAGEEASEREVSISFGLEFDSDLLMTLGIKSDNGMTVEWEFQSGLTIEDDRQDNADWWKENR